MPPIEEADLIEDIVVWERTGFNRENEPVLAAPVELCCRWVDTNRLVTGPEGTPIELSAQIAFPQKVPTRSVCWRGCLDDWDDTGKQELHEIISRSYAKDIDGKVNRYEYNLTRFRGSLPANTPAP